MSEAGSHGHVEAVQPHFRRPWPRNQTGSAFDEEISHYVED